MKKIVTSVLVISVCVVLLASCSAFGPKTAITMSTFDTKAEEAGFTVIDAANQFGEGEIESVHIAMADNYQIEFYIVPTEQQAIAAYNQNKANFELSKGSGSSNSETNIANYSKYTQTSAGMYSVISRIDNTFIYVNADANYKSEINDFLKAIGY